MSNDPYGDILRRTDPSSGALTMAATATAGVNPDERARALARAKRLGYPAAVAQLAPEQVAREAEIADIDDATRDTPVVRRRFGTLDFAALAKDEPSALANFERGVREFLTGQTRPKTKEQALIAMSGEEFGQRVQGMQQRYNLDGDTARSLAAQGVTFTGPNDSFIGPWQRPKASLSAVAKGIYGGVVNTAKGAIAGFQMSGAARDGNAVAEAAAAQRGLRADIAQEMGTPEFDTWAGEMLYGGAQGTAQFLPLLGAGVATGGAAVPMAGFYALTAGNAYRKYRERGGTHNEAALGSTLEGLSEVATELIPFGYMMKSLGRAKGVEFFTSLLGKEVAGENVNLIVSKIVDTAIANPDKTWSDALAELPREMLDTTAMTLVQTGLLAGMSHGLSRTMMRKQATDYEISRAIVAEQQLKRIVAMAGQSKLRERDPQTFADLAQEIAQSQPDAPRDVRFDARTLLEVATPEELKQLPSVQAQLTQGVAPGEEVTIPIGELLSGVAGTPLEKKLLEHARIGDSDLSQYEAKAAQQQAEALLQQDFEQAMQEATNSSDVQRSAEAVKKILLDQLVAANRHTKDASDAMATMAAQMFTVLGHRLGMTAEQVYAKYPLKIVNNRSGQNEDAFSKQNPYAITVEGYHYSKEARPMLDTRAFGTGLKGSGREQYQNATDARRRSRSYFYVDKGTGITPEAGVGGVAHRTQLTNIYDSNSDPLRLRRGDQASFETAVLDAGFSGYLDRMGGDQPGQVVMLGDQQIPVEQLGPMGKTKGQVVPPATKRPAVGRDIVVDALRENTALPAGSLTPQRWSEVLKAALPAEQFAQLDAAGVFAPGESMYKSELINKFEAATEAPVYAQRERPIRQEVADVSGIDSARRIAQSQTWETNRDFKLALQRAVLDAAKSIDLTKDSPEVRAYLVRQILAEARAAIVSAEAAGQASAIGWYDDKVTTAIEVLAAIHPELKTDKESRFAFTWALAITSNGVKVDKNFEIAERAYSHWKTNGKQFPTTGIGVGTSATQIHNGLALYNRMIKAWGFDKFSTFATTLQRNRDIKAQFGRAVSGEGMDTMVYGAGVVGPKIGNGFFMNLHGVFSQLTMDRWWVRMWGRLTGNLVSVDKAEAKRSGEEFTSLIERIKADKAALKAFEDVIQPKRAKQRVKLKVSTLQATAEAIVAATVKGPVRDAMAKILPATPELQAEMVGLRSNFKPDEFVSLGDELRKAAKNYLNKLDGQIEVPQGSRQRDMMRAVANEVQAELLKDYPDITAADFQAVMWYPEKTLYDTASAADGRNDEGYNDDEAPDYANAAVKLARAQGVSDADINAAVERARADVEARKLAKRSGRSAGAVQPQVGSGTGDATEARRHVVNIGLDVPGGGTLSVDEVLTALANAGVTVSQHTVHQSDSEQTVVASLDRALTPQEAYGLSVSLKQEAVAQMSNGQGELYGPQAENWRPFNPQYFLRMDGSRAGVTFNASAEAYAALPDSHGGQVLNTDTARELSPEYMADRTRSADVHEQASAFVKQLYAEKLAAPTPEGKRPVVLFSAGGTGAGKTTGLALLGEAASEAEIIYDTNLNNFESSRKKIDQALMAGREVSIVYVFRDPVDALVNGALRRAENQIKKYGTGRTVPLSAHAETHSQVAETIPKLMALYGDDPRVNFQVIDNSRGAGNAAVVRLADLPSIDYNGLEGKLREAAQHELQAGRISQATYLGTVGQADAAPGLGQQGSAGDGRQLEQSQQTELTQAKDPRGTFNPSTVTIALLERADLSTFHHEMAHFYLEVLTDVASQPGAPADIVGDMDVLLKWFGVKDLDAWRKMSLNERRANHEKFAEHYELYLFEGKAPSNELRDLFRRFSAWMKNVYKSIQAFMLSRGSSLTPEVRRVYDHMLATEAQIRESEEADRFEPLFKAAAEAGMDPRQWAEYQRLMSEAHDTAIEDLQKRGLADMRWLTRAITAARKAVDKAVSAAQKTVHDEVAAEVNAMPVYAAQRALEELRKPSDADKDALKDWRDRREAALERATEKHKAELMASPEAEGLVGIQKGQFIAKNKKMLANSAERDVLLWERDNPKPTRTHDPADLQVVADRFGFSSVPDMLREMMEAQPANVVIEGMTDQRMLERHGDLATEDGAKRATLEAVHNEARARFLATELSALTKARSPIAQTIKAAKLFAAEMIGRKRVRDLYPDRHEKAAARAAAAADKARKAGDNEMTISSKQEQLMHFHLARAASDAKLEAQKIVDRLNRISESKTIAQDYKDQIDKLLERVELRPRTLRDLDRRASLNEWLERQAADGLEPDVPAHLLDDAQLTNWREMTMQELRGLHDTVLQIEHLGKLKKKLLASKDKREFQAIVDELIAGIEKHADARNRKGVTRTATTPGGRALEKLRMFTAAHVKTGMLARELDGGEDGGPMWEHLIRVANERADWETTRRAQATKDLTKILKPWLAKGKLSTPAAFPTIKRSLTRQEILAIALNTGNASNLQRLLGGEGWTLSQVEPVLDSLTKDDWTVVQAVWDYFETFRPEIGAKQKRIYGVEPKWVDPGSPVTEKYGLRGGYYPIKYDSRANQKAEAFDRAEEAKRLLNAAHNAATTRRSFTKARSEKVEGRPLVYDLRGLYTGIDDVIHDLAWHEWLIDSNRLLRAIDDTLRDRYGADAVNQFQTWRVSIAEGDTKAQHAIDSGVGLARQFVSISGLGYNVMSAAIQPLGISNSWARVGARWLGPAVGRYIAHPIDATREAEAKSEFMANRARTRFRDLNELRNRVQGEQGLIANTRDNAFWLMQQMQRTVDVPTWHAGYAKALAEGNSEERAVDLADQAVIDAQGSGLTKDLAAIERGGALPKLFTAFYSFMNTSYNLLRLSGRVDNIGNVLATIVLVGIMPAILTGLLRNALTPGDSGEDEDWEKLARKMAADQVSYLMGMVVGVREFTEAAKTMLHLADQQHDYSGPTGLRAVNDVYRFVQQAHQGEFDDAFRKSAVNLVGDVTGLPSAQINRSITGFNALNEGETENPLALLFGYQEPK